VSACPIGGTFSGRIADSPREIVNSDISRGKLDYKQDRGIERSLIMLLMSTMSWIIIGVVVVILAVVIGKKIKDTYY